MLTKLQKEEKRIRERNAFLSMTPEQKDAYYKRKKEWRLRNPFSEMQLQKRRDKAKEVRMGWTQERIDQQKRTQKYHYEKCQIRTAVGFCAYSVSCNEAPIGKQRFCLWHWCNGLRQADPRCKSQYTTDELVAQWNSQQGKCDITGISLIAGETAALDHIIPVARGGASLITNIRFIHSGINRFKWDMLDEEFKLLIPSLCPKLIEWAKKTT